MFSEIKYNEADSSADKILSKLSLPEKIEFIGGHKLFFIKGLERLNIPELYLSDATQGVHIRKELSNQLENSTAFPCPLALTATWNTELAYRYAMSIGEECRAGGISFLLGPGVNIYRISQCGRNFEYFGEDPYLAAMMVSNYITGIQSTGVVATLKHFLCNNTDFHRRTSNSIVDERTLHEIYLPAFKAGIDAGAMVVMTAYNLLNGEYCGQSYFVINQILRKYLGFKGLVMTDWWSVNDPLKVIKSGQDLEMPGVGSPTLREINDLGDIYVKSNALKLLQEGKIREDEITRMAKSVIRTCIYMDLYDKPIQDKSLLSNFSEHEKISLQTAREAIVLLKNQNNILPIKKDSTKKILITGEFVEKIAFGGGSAEVEGYNNITMLEALTHEFGNQIEYITNPSDQQIKSYPLVILSIGTYDNEGWDRPFELPENTETLTKRITNLNPNTIVIINSGSGIKMTDWNDKPAAILYSWYIGQNGNIALAEILSGKTCPSGKLPITIEKKFEDSPGYPYIPENETFYTGWDPDLNIRMPINNIEYKEGVFVGYRWYEIKQIEPLYHFGYGLSYTKFEYNNFILSKSTLKKNEQLKVEFQIKNIGEVAGAEIAQVYVSDTKSSVPRPIKELKGFQKLVLKPGEHSKISIVLDKKSFSFWDVNTHDWVTEAGEFTIMVGAASNDVRFTEKIIIE